MCKNSERYLHLDISYPAGNKHENTLSNFPARNLRLLSGSLAPRAFSKQNVSEAEKAWYP